MTEKIAFTFKCPHCQTHLGFSCLGAVLNPDKSETLTIDDLSEIIGKAPVTIDDFPDHYEIRPTHYLGDAFNPLHKQLKAIGAKWVSDKTNKANSHWTVPKTKS